MSNKVKLGIKGLNGERRLYRAERLIIAANHNRPKIIQLLIDFNADINPRDNDGLTALSHANKNKYQEVTSILKNNGAIE